MGVHGNNQGGLSGPAIKPVALLKTHQVCQPHNISTIGQDGITTAQDAIEFLVAGAAAVGELSGSLRLHGNANSPCACD